ncbi:MAG: DUF2088 domain-containing protein [Candidatus Sabulitectum sp.]|nr:DUF2088 domain-containing protein [Candidatus Sabulitectum sp.]
MSISDIWKQLVNMDGVITVVVNDGTRPSPAEQLSALHPALAGRVRFLFATGTHRPVTMEERKKILGDLYADDVTAESNVCDDGTHMYLGTTSRGTEVDVHRWLLEGPVLAVNTVEPHYFAGFSGGRKSFIPGASSRKTIVQNHFLACSLEAQPGRLEGNPVHEDLMEAAEFLAKRTEIVMVNGVYGIDSLFCGPYDTSFFQAAEVAALNCGVSVSERYASLEVRPGNNLDVSLYQAMKAVFLWESVVVDGGELVLAAGCSEGLGAPQMERLLSASSASIAIPRSPAEYLLGDHAAIRLNRIRSRIRLSFRIGIDMQRFGFSVPPSGCEAVVENAGFSYPLYGSIK